MNLFRSITPKRRRRGQEVDDPELENKDIKSNITDEMIARMIELEGYIGGQKWDSGKL